jgi:hypothetical protein
MNTFQNPALKNFLASFQFELVFAQVLICRVGNEFELRHVDDRKSDSENLRPARENELREIAQFAANGSFRPLKSAPNLQTGWRFSTRDQAQLEFALNTLYPGAIADWFAEKFSKATPTNYREFTNRQTGMYRITAMLNDVQAAAMIRACCHKNFCLKQRLWSVDGLETDSLAEKSLIPCLEPCAILLEFARKAMRLEQQAERAAELHSAENLSTEQNPEPQGEIREADFENPQNPRRLQLLREKEKVSA